MNRAFRIFMANWCIRSSKSQTNDGIPLIEYFPLARYLAGVEDRSFESSTFFVFLRPVILRDDEFRDLRYLSEEDAAAATPPATTERGSSTSEIAAGAL